MLDGMEELPETELIKIIIEEEAMLYVAGYVAYRFKNKYPELGQATDKVNDKVSKSRWVVQFSRGRLIFPSESLIRAAEMLEEIFVKFHKNDLSDEDLIFTKVAALLKMKLNDLDLPDEVLLCLVRTRTYIRLRNLRIKLKNDIKKRRAQNTSKNLKFM